jgi:hypothetical protein
MKPPLQSVDATPTTVRTCNMETITQYGMLKIGMLENLDKLPHSAFVQLGYALMVTGKEFVPSACKAYQPHILACERKLIISGHFLITVLFNRGHVYIILSKMNVRGHV